METFLISAGYPALFLLSFLAATLLPLGSEWLLVVLLLQGYDPLVSVALATLGNTLGALTSYAVGLWGGPYLIERVWRLDAAQRRRAETFYARFGRWSLLLAWLPLVGDPLCLIGGLLRTGWLSFVILVGAGKLARYGVVAWLVLPGAAPIV
ncbi:MAG: DedA family protein [Desulfuromonadaceae bacterium]